MTICHIVNNHCLLQQLKMLFTNHNTNSSIVAKGPWDTYKKNYEKPYSSQLLHPCTLHVPPLPLDQCCFLCKTLDIVVHVKFSHCSMYFSQKMIFLGGRWGIKVKCKIKSAKCPRTFGDYCSFQFLLKMISYPV